MMTPKVDTLLPLPKVYYNSQAAVPPRIPPRGTFTRTILLGLGAVYLTGIALVCAGLFSSIPTTLDLGRFYRNVSTHEDLCIGLYGKAVSHSGYIGLKTDSDENPKRSFFWLFEAQGNRSEDAPVILTFGGGPGTSGMTNPMIGQSHCAITADGPIPNPNAWTEHYNLLALDHPIGVGFSYGTRVNNSRAAAHDVYDFLQKFYILFPQLAKNNLVLASGSYGGTYIPHIATVIHEENLALASGKGNPGAIHIKLESMMVSNPYSDSLAHYRWALQQRCYYTDLYNATTCEHFFSVLPFCLEAVQFAYENPTLENRVNAGKLCHKTELGQLQGRSYENVNQRCDGTYEGCVPQSVWVSKFFNSTSTRQALGIPDHVFFSALNMEVNKEFEQEGDRLRPTYLLYEPLLKAGYRLLHYVGKLDANCAWPGIISFLKLLHTPFQEDFINTPDLAWGSEDATVRAVGEGAGNMTYILMGGAGHFVTKDQPVLVKKIVEHWIDNRPFV